jgi:anti-sigma factor RsiW
MKRQRVPGSRQLWAEGRERLRHLRFCGAVEAFADGELTGRRQVRVAAHIACCRACSGSLQTLRLIKASLRRSPRRTPESLASVRVRRFARRLAAPPRPGP